MRTKPKSSTPWMASKIGSKLKPLGIVYGDTEEEAVEEASKEHVVPKNRIVVKRWE